MNLAVSWISRARQLLVVVSLVVLPALPAQAQNSTMWTTNFYSVTGENFREIRASIAKARPWKEEFDGDTRWDVEWKFQFARKADACACSSFSVSIKIVTTLPRWTPPAGVDPAVKDQWTRFYNGLAQHEAGHARIGMAAAAEVGKKISEVPAQLDCAAVKKLISERAESVVADYRAREKEYDRRTDHGRQPGGLP